MDTSNRMKQVEDFSRRNFKVKKISNSLIKNPTRMFADVLDYELSFEFSNNQLTIVFPSDGTKFWYQNDKIHRTDGPAIEKAADGTKFWFQNGELHRTDGPAIEHADGTKYWYLEGKEFTKIEFTKRNKK